MPIKKEKADAVIAYNFYVRISFQMCNYKAVPFFEQNSGFFKKTFPIFQVLNSVQKRALSLCHF